MRTVDFTGTVSHATMRTQDVLPACMNVLAKYAPDKFDNLVYEIAFAGDMRFTQHQARTIYTDLLADDNSRAWYSEHLGYILNEHIWDAMNEIAPLGYYFGAHPGDGSDYGYWMIEEEEF